MRKLCPNVDREDGLETVLEVPIPEELFVTNGGSRGGKPKRLNCSNAWSRLQMGRSASTVGSRNTELQLLLGVIGAPLVPLPVVPPHHNINHSIKQDPIEVSMAKYIVTQYVAATGGEKALQSIGSMYAMGKVRMTASDFSGSGGNKKSAKGGAGGEMGGFVLWQKKPDLWCLELVVSGCKISAGSDGQVAWRQTPWHPPHASRGPPRPLRRSLQGLDPRSTADLFSNSVCIGEKTVNGDDCFALRLDSDPSTLLSRSSNSVEIIRHTVWGYFSHRTGLLVQLEDSHLLRMKSADESVYWETSMESSIEDYRPIDGVYIAHAGRTSVSLFRFGDTAEGHTRTRMEETWAVEEVEFNIRGLSMDCFLPPGDLKRSEQEGCDVFVRTVRPPPLSVHMHSVAAGGRIGPSKVAAVEMEDSDSTTDDEEGRHW